MLSFIHTFYGHVYNTLLKRVLILAILWLSLNFVRINIMRHDYVVLNLVNLVRIVKISTLKTEKIWKRQN